MVPLAIRLAALKMTSSAPARQVNVYLDSNGSPRLAHLSLANTNVRNFVYHTLKTTELEVKLTLPSGCFRPANKTVQLNLDKTITAWDRAGLLHTNSTPNSYE